MQRLLLALVALTYSIMAFAAPGSTIKFKLREDAVAHEDFTSLAGAAAEVCAMAELPTPTRVFRPIPKHEEKHRRAGLNRWYQVSVAGGEEDAALKLAELRERSDVVEVAEIEQSVKLANTATRTAAAAAAAASTVAWRWQGCL
mmetsp:Transcript_48936/g.83620  ORF Transcript_48936/g.83620 Transcript_48936/m.83620 type:complete len:144 (+) Transcript_48936:22-453(+)